MFFSTQLRTVVIKLEDPFNLIPGVVFLTIVKGLARIGRGIKVVSNSLILSFNLAFSTSKPSIESSRASPVSLWILEMWDSHMYLRSTSERDFPF
jgi:hypothetical protein